MIKKKVFFFAWLLLSVTYVIAQVQDVFVPRADQPVQPLHSYLMVHENANDTITIQTLLKQKNIPFRHLPAETPIDLQRATWLKMELSPGFSSDSFYIGLLSGAISGIDQGNDRSDVWIVQGDSICRHYETGSLTPLSKGVGVKPFNHNLFPVSLRAGLPFTVYWRIQRTLNFAPLQFNFALQHAAVLQSGMVRKLPWFYTGVMFILFMLGLVFFVITRERPFAWFAGIAAVLCMHIHLLEPGNSLTQWLFPEYPFLQLPFFTLLTSLFSIFILQFIRSFTQTRYLLPIWDKVIRIVIGYTVTGALLSFILMAVYPAENISGYVFIAAFLFNIIIAVRLIITRDVYALWAGLALLWLFSFQVLALFWNARVLPFWIPNPWIIAQIGMMVILFVALAYRFKQSATEKAEAAKVLEMDAIKSRFFANISHEFRTPLTLMLGPLKQMEENETEDPQKKRHFGMMRRNGERLLQLINQLLDLSKLESGKMKLQVCKTDISGFLKIIAGSFESLAEQQQVNYHMHFPEENITGFCDRDKLEKIVVNLLSNAFRFTAANGSISFSVERDEKRLRFMVQDSGIGLPKEQLDHIFNRFHQVSGTEGGTGIGLSLVKELLQLHKGQISVHSKSGQGSSFRVSIPVTAEFYRDEDLIARSIFDNPVIDSGSVPASTIEEEIVQQDSLLPMILVAEDNTDLQQYILDILTPYFQVEVAGNGILALEKATTLIPECIISDIMMPGMDGIELCKQLKNHAATSHVPVILLTAKAGSNSRVEGLQTGADDYLVKPFDAKELVVRISNLIEQRKQLRDRYSRQVISVQPESLTIVPGEQLFIQRVRQAIDENIDNDLFGVAELANAIHLSRSQLHRKLKALTGQSPNELIRNYRLERALQLLQQNGGTVTEIAFQTGFSSVAYFSKCFSDRYGYAPGELKKQR
ncbi:MAG: ATP-binding protein [Sediminibacterium sp.]